VPDESKSPTGGTVLARVLAQCEGAIMNDVATVNAARKAESASSENHGDVCRHEAERVSAARHDARQWTRMPITNMARSGPLSSDGAIRKYCERIWDARAMKVNLAEP
jgi:glucan phosphorylase